MTRHDNRGVGRISVSLPQALLQELDQMVEQRGFDSRSQAIAEMINFEVTAHKKEQGDEIMAGTLTLLYDHSTPKLQKRLADLQQEYIQEVITSLHVHLMHSQTMEVILVQGPAARLQLIADKMTTNRGVISGRLQLTTTLLPQLQFPSQPQRKVAGVVHDNQW